MKKKIVIGLILTLIVLAFILYVFTSKIFRKEEPKIILEEEDIDLHPTILYSKGISILFYNTTFRLEILRFSSSENKTTYLNYLLNFTNNSIPVEFGNINGYKFFAISPGGEPFSGYFLDFDTNLFNCYLLPKNFTSVKDYDNSLIYLEEVCKWFIEKKLSDYLWK